MPDYTFHGRLSQLITMDNIRKYKIIEMIQYTFFFFLLSLLVATILNKTYYDKVRELDESTQVYVPIGRTIPNEIREELITTQYGKMPEDVKNVKDINYGNFMENSITMNNDFWTKVLHGTKGE